MEITDVRVRLATDTTDRLKGFCTVTFDDVFVVRDIKIVDGTSGLFIAMPSRKRTTACRKCRHRNQFRARFCEDCGERLHQEPIPADDDGRNRLHRDIAHPITAEFRKTLQEQILEAYLEEFEQSSVAEPAEPELEGAQEDTQEDTEEAVSEVSDERKALEKEYDDLIAEVKGGTENNSPRKERPRRPAPARDRNRPRHEDRSRREKSTADNPPAERKRAESKPVEPKPAKTQSSPAQQEREHDTEDDTFGAGIGLGAAEEEVSISAEAETPRETCDDSEDSTAFGAGIL